MEKLTFGTDGIRGKANKFPFLPQPLQRLGQAISEWATKKYGNNICVLIGHDTRISCDEIKKNLCIGLSSKIDHIVDVQILPTPAVLKIINSKKVKPCNNDTFKLGIVISASHNQYQDNGIKFFDAETGKLSHKDEEIILQNFEKSSADDKQKVSKINTFPKSYEIYKESVLAHFKPNFLSGKKIVLDCANGATYKIAPEIFNALGAKVIAIGINPNGKNINEKCGALHPEETCKKVLEHNADIGFAFDGDGDRVIAVNKNGIIKDGDDILAILIQSKDFSNETSIVGTVMTNYGFEDFLNKLGKTLVRTKVGDKHVAAHLEKNNFFLGGEASGHIIMKNYLITGDGIFVALKTIETIIDNNNWGMKTFEKTPQILLNIPVTYKKDLEQEKYQTIIKKHEEQLINGRIVVRYSGTENLLRIMVEDQTIKSAQIIAKNLGDELKESL